MIINKKEVLQMEWIQGFERYLISESKSKNTILTYSLNIREYLNWFTDTYGVKFTELYRENVLDYKSYLLNIRKYKGKQLNGKTINNKLSSLLSFNEYLVEEKYQEDIVLKKKDLIKLQSEFVNPCKVTKGQVEQFRQRILQAEDKRMYAIVTLLAYGGLRISEALSVKQQDYCLQTRELVVRQGKGEKQRIVYLNSKVVNAIREYLKVRREVGEYLFVSRQNATLDRTVVNRAFKKYSKEVLITPHMLRHFYITNCLETGVYSLHEIAYQVGHKDLRNLLIYTNPSVQAMKDKAELL